MESSKIAENAPNGIEVTGFAGEINLEINNVNPYSIGFYIIVTAIGGFAFQFYMPLGIISLIGAFLLIKEFFKKDTITFTNQGVNFFGTWVNFSEIESFRLAVESHQYKSGTKTNTYSTMTKSNKIVLYLEDGRQLTGGNHLIREHSEFIYELIKQGCREI